MSFEKISKFLSQLAPFLTVGVVVVTLANFLILNSLSPIKSDIRILDGRVDALEAENDNQVDKVEITDLKIYLDSKFNDLIHRVDIISSRLDKAIQK